MAARAVPDPRTRRPKLDNKTTVIGFFGILAVLFVIGTLMKAIQPPGPPTCTVAYSTSDLNIQVTGQGAAEACQRLMPIGPGAEPNGYPYGTGNLGQPSTNDVVCSFKLNGLAYTIRDTGILPANAVVACDTLKPGSAGTKQ